MDQIMFPADMKDAPIGVFDSGIGGLTVLKMMRHALPAERFIYVGDLGRSPYGSKSAETVRRCVLQITAFLLSHHVKMIVIACNTASAVAGDIIRECAYPVPVIEVVGRGSEMALEMIPPDHRGDARVGILGTDTTVRSGVYADRIRVLADARGMRRPEILQQACPLFVPLVEEGWWSGEIPDLTAARYLRAMREFKPHVVILGCTHFPVLSEPIAKALPEGTILTDCAPAVVQRAEAILRERGWLVPAGSAGSAEGPAETVFYCSDSIDTFRCQAERFLDMPVDFVHHVDLETVSIREGDLCCPRQISTVKPSSI